METALVMLFVFLPMVFGIIEASRWLFGFVAIGEATREGARVAAVCTMGDPEIEARMRDNLTMATGGTATVAYQPAGCTAVETTFTAGCQSLTVTAAGWRVPTILPIFPSMPLPPVTTFLSRESLDSTNNPRCS